MHTNPNTDYELFTRHIYEVIVNNTSFTPTHVKHNIKLEGQSGAKHQIDVYFEYENDSGKHPVVIECKNYSTLVPIGKIRDFFGLLYDVGKDVKGVMVSKKGFQRGVKTYAKKYGISLIKLQEVSESDIVGTINTRNSIEKIHHLYSIDETFAKEHRIKVDSIRKFYSEFQPYKADYWLNSPYVPLETTDSVIYDSFGNKLSSIDDLDNCTPFKKNQDFLIKFKDAWVNTRAWGMVKINGVKIECEIDEQELTINLQAKGFVEALMKDVLSDETRYIPKL